MWMEEPQGHANRSTTDPLTGLCARELVVRAGHQKLLNGVSLQLQPGQVGAILGPNGAGKSTLLSTLAGLSPPNAGKVWLDGVEVKPAQLQSLALRRAVLPQNARVAFDFKVQDIVALGRYPHRRHPSCAEHNTVQAAMRTTGICAMANRSMANLSGGEHARVQLARALAQIWEPSPDGLPRWLLLDEPTAAMDLKHQHSTLLTVRQWAKEQGVGVLAVVHDVNLALRYADHAVVLKNGALQASGAPHSVLSPSLIQQVWGVQATPVFASDGTPQMLIA